jgi:hypothetical protein
MLRISNYYRSDYLSKNPFFMASFQKGILGGFSGKVGTVVGGNWKGIDYMRSKGGNKNKTPPCRSCRNSLSLNCAPNFCKP